MFSLSRAMVTAPRRALTFVEALVAIAVTLIIIAAATTTYIRISGQVAAARAYADATANARAALRDMSFEVKQANTNPADPFLFLGTDVQGAAGDRIDNDGDGSIDEDRPDGIDEDGNFTDQHALTGVKRERPAFVGTADLGDLGVDSDPDFDADALEYRIFPGPTTLNVRIRYSLGTFDGEPNVLLREVETDPGTAASTTTIEPLAYSVLGLNFLYWDANLATPYWVASWDATAGPFPGPNIELPAAVYIEVAVYAGTRPLATLDANDPRPVVMLSTIANLEGVITDPRYDTVRPPS